MIYSMPVWLYAGLIALALAAGGLTAATVAAFIHERLADEFWKQAEADEERAFIDGTREGLRRASAHVLAAEHYIDALERLEPVPDPAPTLMQLPAPRAGLAAADGETTFVQALRLAPIDQVADVFTGWRPAEKETIS
jgi:hypothetical protein